MRDNFLHQIEMTQSFQLRKFVCEVNVFSFIVTRRIIVQGFNNICLFLVFIIAYKRFLVFTEFGLALIQLKVNGVLGYILPRKSWSWWIFDDL